MCFKIFYYSENVQTIKNYQYYFTPNVPFRPVHSHLCDLCGWKWFQFHHLPAHGTTQSHIYYCSDITDDILAAGGLWRCDIWQAKHDREGCSRAVKLKGDQVRCVQMGWGWRVKKIGGATTNHAISIQASLRPVLNWRQHLWCFTTQ